MLEVGRIGDRTPEPGPLEEYQKVFPERYVQWEPFRQLWEIRQVNPVTGHDERVELVFHYVVRPDVWENLPPGIRGLGKDVVTAYLTTVSPGSTVKMYRPFDYEFVRQRIREWYELRNDGAEKLVNHAVDQNEKRFRQVKRHVAGEIAAGFGEIRRWIPALHSGHADDRIPLVQGANLTGD